MQRMSREGIVNEHHTCTSRRAAGPAARATALRLEGTFKAGKIRLI
jgi:hypothetical protein